MRGLDASPSGSSPSQGGRHSLVCSPRLPQNALHAQLQPAGAGCCLVPLQPQLQQLGLLQHERRGEACAWGHRGDVQVLT